MLGKEVKRLINKKRNKINLRVDNFSFIVNDNGVKQKDCKTIRAFRRFLRKAPKGIYVLVRYGCTCNANFYGNLKVIKK